VAGLILSSLLLRTLAVGNAAGLILSSLLLRTLAVGNVTLFSTIKNSFCW
jgi:hypothetical protein